MMRLRFILLPALLALSLVSSLRAQSTNTFSANAAPISLPGGGVTFIGSESGVTLAVTRNIELRESNLIGSNGFEFFGGGVNYYLPVLSAKLNNVSPNLNGYRFRFHVTGSVGMDRVPSGADWKQHYAFKAGGGVDYDLTASGRWTFGVEVEYAKLPGFANNTAIVKVGPSFHF